MPNNAISIISGSRVSASREEVIGKWLVMYCSIFDRGLTPLLSATWCHALSDLDIDTINAACGRVLKTAKFFPNPGDIREHITQAKTRALDLNAEIEWTKALRQATEFWHRDIGLYPDAPKLSAATIAAMQAAGGLSYLESCNKEALQFARRRFIERYKVIQETGQDQNLLSSQEAKQILGRLSSGLDSTKDELRHDGDSGTELVASRKLHL